MSQTGLRLDRVSLSPCCRRGLHIISAKVEGLAAGDWSRLPAHFHFKTSQNGFAASLLSMEKSKSLQHRTSEHQLGKECWQRLSLKSNRTRKNRLCARSAGRRLSSHLSPSTVRRGAAYLEAGIPSYAHAIRGLSAPTPRPPRFRLFWRAALCRLWQLYGSSLFDDCCLVVCPCSIFGPLWTGLAIDNEPLPTCMWTTTNGT